ncbi:MAG: ABC transporter substrate-binding protein [Betaproteobacteria bacterium]|nr:ABC transporter substrate-binding protein [Betaproteobacteria bacterium]
MTQDKLPHQRRRDLLKLTAGAAIGSLAPMAGLFAQSAKFTEWGWPEPYEQVSAKSIEWLKSKGWLPLSIGFFADLPGYSGSYAVIRDLDLLGKRGLAAKFTSFLSGPPILEAFIGQQTQATGYGDLPFWTTVARGNPAMAYGMTAVNYEAAMLVRPDSPLKSIRDLKGRSEPVVIGTLLGSFLEFYISAAADNVGLVPNKDYKLAGMTLREAQFIPKGVDAVVSYDPFVSVTLNRKIGRKIDDAFPYYFNKGYDFVRKEIHANAPDVVQALADAMLEATLFTRFDIEKAVTMYHSDTRVATAYPRDLFLDQTRKYVTLYKPTYRYLHPDFWAQQDVVVAKSQFEKKRMPKELSVADMKACFEPSYMGKSLAKCGIAVPKEPVFLPPGWKGTVGKPPYPTYANFANMKGPQPFPEKGDLTRPWRFKNTSYNP